MFSPAVVPHAISTWSDPQDRRYMCRISGRNWPAAEPARGGWRPGGRAHSPSPFDSDYLSSRTAPPNVNVYKLFRVLGFDLHHSVTIAKFRGHGFGCCATNGCSGFSVVIEIRPGVLIIPRCMEAVSSRRDHRTSDGRSQSVTVIEGKHQREKARPIFSRRCIRE